MRKVNSVSRMMAGASALAFIVSASGALALPAPSTYTVSGQTPEQVYLNASRLSNSVLSNLGGLSTGSYLFNYVTVYFTPDTDVTGATFGVYEANFDPVSILYSGSFNPLNPSTNAIAGNDDSPSLVTNAGLTGTCGSVCSGFSANLIGGQTYYLFLSTYSSGTAFTTPVSFFATGTNFNWGTYTPNPPASTDIDTAAPGGYDASQLGTNLNAVFAGGTLYFSTPGAIAQNFQLGNSATNTIDLRGVSVNLDGDLTDQTTNGSIIFTNTGGSQTSILLNGNSTYTGSTTIENNVFLSLYGSINNTSSIQIRNGGVVIVRSGGEITAGHITNDVGGQLLIDQGATVTDDLDNAGYVENSGTYNAIVNTNTGTIINTGTGIWNGEVRSNVNYLTNAGTWNGDIASSGDFTNSGTLNGDLTVSGWGTANNSHIINGTVTLNDGNFTNTGTVNGDLNNIASSVGMSTLTGGGIITGSVTNSGQIEVTADMTTGAITNGGDVTVSDGMTLTADSLTSDVNGRVWVNANATLNSSVSNANYFENAGTVNGTLISNSEIVYNNGVWTGNILSNTGAIDNTGTWNGDITTSGFFSSNGTINGDLTNSGDAILYGTINGAVNNSGSINISADLSTGAFTNTGSVEIYDGASLTADSVVNGVDTYLGIVGTLNSDVDNAGYLGNAGTVNGAVNTNTDVIASSGVWNGNVLSNTGTVYNYATATWNGDITSAGSLVNRGTINGNLTTSGTAQAEGTINGTVTNTGGFDIVAALETGQIINNGTLTIYGSGNLTAEGVTNQLGGQLTIRQGGTLTDDMDNAGAVDNAGISNAIVNTNSGTISNFETGVWNGEVLSNSGTLINAGVWNGDVTTSGTFASVGTLNGDLTNSGEALVGGVFNGTVTNSGTLALDGNLGGNGAAFDNTGTLIIGDNGFNDFGAVSNSAAGNITVGTLANAGFLNAASLSNAGALHMANGRAGDVTTITGTYTGIAGSVLSFDVNMLTGDADRLTVGNLSGTSTVRLNNSAAGRTYLSAPVVLVSAGGGDGTLTADSDAGTAAVLGTDSLMSYRFTKIAGTDDWGIVSSLNTPALTSLSASLTAYVTAQNLNLADLPEEVFVRDGAYGVNQWMANSWARAYSGDLSLKSDFTTSDDYSSGTTTKAKSSQDGVQYGFDAGVYNIHGTGLSLRAGFMGGSTDAKVTDKTLSGANVKIDAPNYGYYAALTHKGLRLSVQNRNEILKADVTNPALGLSNSRLKARSETFSVALSNRFDVSHLFVEPVIGYMTTKVDADTLDIPADMGSVKIASLKSKLIRAGVRVGTELATERVVFTPYGELNAWQEDAAKTQTAYVPESGNGAVWMAGQRTGTFGQALVGLSAQSRSNENLSGHLTADARLGDTLNGWTVRAGVKYRLK